MTDPIEGHWPKIIRAEEHQAAARAEFDFYREGDVYRLIGEFDLSGTEYVLRTELRYPPSPRFAILIGEFFNCLRGALDHFAYRLVAKWNPKRTAQPETIYFPIWDSNLNKRGNPRKKSDLMASVKGIPKPAIAIIEGQQPYHCGNDAPAHPLSIIRRLSNIDKHRQLILVASVGASGTFGVTCKGQILASRVIFGDFKPGTEITRLPLTWQQAQAAGCASHEEMDVHGYAPIRPTFSEPEPPLDRPVYEVLEECVEYVRTLVARVAPEGGLI